MRPVIGIPLRYSHLSDGRPILYLGEIVRRTFQKAGAYVFPIAPVQDVDYMNTKGNEFPALTNDEKKVIKKNLEMCDGVFFPGGTKFTPYDRYLLECCIEMQIPVLAVCLGMQMMGCYDEEVKLEDNQSSILHHQGDDDISLVHQVIIDKNSKLYKGNVENWGNSKGSTYNNVCVVLNQNTYNLYKENNLKDLKMATRNKLYVACTRTKNNLFFVEERKLIKYKKEVDLCQI